MEKKYVITVSVAAESRKRNAILEALHNTDQYIQDWNYKPIVYNGKSEASYYMSRVYSALEDTTYIRRNAHTALKLAYSIVYMLDGEDYAMDTCGRIDQIEVRGLKTGKVALRYKLTEVTNDKV